MAANDNLIFKTSTSKTIDDLFTWNKTTGAISAKTDVTPMSPGTVYFTSDGHIIYDLDSTHRLWMGKEAYSAVYAQDLAATDDIMSLLSADKYWADIQIATAPTEIAEPTFKATRFVEAQGATKSAIMEYNATTETLNFRFT